MSSGVWEQRIFTRGFARYGRKCGNYLRHYLDKERQHRRCRTHQRDSSDQRSHMFTTTTRPHALFHLHSIDQPIRSLVFFLLNRCYPEAQLGRGTSGQHFQGLFKARKNIHTRIHTLVETTVSCSSGEVIVCSHIDGLGGQYGVQLLDNGLFDQLTAGARI